MTALILKGTSQDAAVIGAAALIWQDLDKNV
jgi:hypothetical protein